jgi:tetratricopeptide (TPR) repeat protein
MRRRLFGELHPDVALGLTNLSRMLSEDKQFDESITLCEQAIEQHRKLFGDKHPHTAAVLGTYAKNLEVAGRPADAVAPSRKVLEIYQATFGPNNRRTLDANFSLGSRLNVVGDFPGAEEQFRAMLAWGRANYPSGDNRTSAVIMLVAKAVMNQGRYTDAEALFREALDARLGNKANPRQIADSRNALADCLVAQQRRADAEPLLIAVEKDAQGPGVTPAARAAAIDRLVAFYAAWHAAEPTQGYDAKAVEWKMKMEAQKRAELEAKPKEKATEKKR